jgi:hypothetical protein
MPSVEEKQRRRAIAQQLKAAQAASLQTNMPLRGEQLEELFDYLDSKLTENGCGNTLYHTEQFALERTLPFQSLKVWLEAEGGYCNCEIIANVEEKFEGLI